MLLILERRSGGSGQGLGGVGGGDAHRAEAAVRLRLRDQDVQERAAEPEGERAVPRFADLGGAGRQPLEHLLDAGDEGGRGRGHRGPRGLRRSALGAGGALPGERRACDGQGRRRGETERGGADAGSKRFIHHSRLLLRGNFRLLLTELNSLQVLPERKEPARGRRPWKTRGAAGEALGNSRLPGAALDGALVAARNDAALLQVVGEV